MLPKSPKGPPRSKSFPAWPYSCPHVTFSLPQRYQHMHECCRVSSSFVCRWQQIHVLVNYLQVFMITCSRYCVSVGMTLMNLFLKLEKSSWWEKGQGSLLLGCVGQTGLMGQQLKQARKVSAVSLHPQSCVFLLRKSLLTSLCCSQNPHPFHFPPLPLKLSHLSLPHISLPAAELLK